MSETIVVHNVKFLIGDVAELPQSKPLNYGGTPREFSELGFKFLPINPEEGDWIGDPKAFVDEDKMDVKLGVTLITSRRTVPLEASPTLFLPVIALWQGVESYPYLLSENERLASTAFKYHQALLLDSKEELTIELT